MLDCLLSKAPGLMLSEGSIRKMVTLVTYCICAFKEDSKLKDELLVFLFNISIKVLQKSSDPSNQDLCKKFIENEHLKIFFGELREFLDKLVTYDPNYNQFIQKDLKKFIYNELYDSSSAKIILISEIYIVYSKIGSVISKNSSLEIEEGPFYKTVTKVQTISQELSSLSSDVFNCLDTYMTSSQFESYVGKENPQLNVSDLTVPESLKHMSKSELEKQVMKLLEFNTAILPLTDFFIENKDILNSMNASATDHDLLEDIVKKNKNYIFSCIFNKKIETILEQSDRGYCYDFPTVNYVRQNIMAKKDKGKVDTMGEWTMFSTTMNAFSSNYSKLMFSGSDDKGWNANFEGEGSIDQGGPYRDSISNIVDEIHSSFLPLFIQTPNNTHQHGFGRDQWTINPSSTSARQMEMYEFLGALIGMAFRSGQYISLRVPSMFWKNFVEESVTMDDLEGLDAYAVQGMNELSNVKLNVSSTTNPL